MSYNVGDQQPPTLEQMDYQNEYQCGTCMEVRNTTPCHVCSEEGFKPPRLTRQGGFILSDKETKNFYITGELPVTTPTVPTSPIGGGGSLGTETAYDSFPSFPSSRSFP